MTERVPLKHVKTYRVGGKVYHYSRITKERLPDNPKERAARVRAINKDPTFSPAQAEKQAVERLKRRKTALQGTIEDLEKSARHLEKRIKSAKAQARQLGLTTEGVDALRRPNALWSWVPPMLAPKRLRGVYRLMKAGRTVYIGQSVDILSRVTTHAAEKDFDEFSYALVDGGRQALNEIEAALITLEQPPENRLATLPRWTPEEAQAVLDKYRIAVAGNEDEEAA